MVRRLFIAILLIAAPAFSPAEGTGFTPEKIAALEAAFAGKPSADAAHEVANARYLLAIDGKKPENIDPAAVLAAVEWAERARGMGSAAATSLLYLIYSEGAGIPADTPKAVAYLHEAVDKGDAGARTNYALALFRGVPGIPRDRALAARYLTELAREKVKVPAIYYHLGVLTFRGEGGVKQDSKEAMRLIQFAADERDPEAMKDVAKNYEFGWTTKVDLHRALEWYLMAADEGEGYAQWRIGMAYVKGEEREADPLLAVEWFERAAKSGNSDGMTSLAVMYATGEGVKQDYARARELYEEAASAGEAHALLNLAGMYLRGEGVPVDMPHGYALLSKSAEMGDPQAADLLPQVAKEMTAEQLAEAERRIRQQKD